MDYLDLLVSTVDVYMGNLSKNNDFEHLKLSDRRLTMVRDADLGLDSVSAAASVS